MKWAAIRSISSRARLTARSYSNRNARRERRDQGRARSSIHPSVFVAHHDAPLIGECAATRGQRNGGGDEGAGVQRSSSVRTPASRTGSSGGNRDPWAATRPLKCVRQNQANSAEPSRRRTRQPSHTATPAANDATGDTRTLFNTSIRPRRRNDAPLMGERATSRTRIVTEGDDERLRESGAIRLASAAECRAAGLP